MMTHASHVVTPAAAKPMNGKPVFTVPAKTVLNLESGFRHKLLCDGPTFSMGDACAYTCAFCYVPEMFRKLERLQALTREQGLAHEDMVVRRAGALDLLRGQLLDARGRRRFPDSDDHRVVYASPAVDVAANPELCEETVEAVALILEHTAWQVRLLSKSNLLPKIADHLEATRRHLRPRERVIYGVSTGTLEDGLAAAFEENTPLVRRRLQSLHWLQDHGFRTFGMICPSLPLPGDAYPEFAREMAAAIRAERCEHVWAEVINVRGDSMVRTVEALRAAGFEDHAAELRRVSLDALAWEAYARETFEAHAKVYAGQGGAGGGPKLRFLQYVTAASKPWWKAREGRGAILL